MKQDVELDGHSCSDPARRYFCSSELRRPLSDYLVQGMCFFLCILGSVSTRATLQKLLHPMYNEKSSLESCDVLISPPHLPWALQIQGWDGPLGNWPRQWNPCPRKQNSPSQRDFEHFTGITLRHCFFFRIARFSNVYHLSIHVSKNFGADTTKIFYIGLRGEWMEVSGGWFADKEV